MATDDAWRRHANCTDLDPALQPHGDPPMPKRIDTLTPDQAAQMQTWADKWIDLGLSTEPADFDTFERNVRRCYELAGLDLVLQPIGRVGEAEPIAEEEREYVVAVHSLRRGHVDLDAVPKPEEPLRAVSLPHDRIER